MREEIIKMLYFTQVIEEVLEVVIKEAKVEYIGVKVSLLTELPSTLKPT